MYKSGWGFALNTLHLPQLKEELEGNLDPPEPREINAHVPADLCGF